ncbi:MauE/DoxX family redox-associated membrane protein [Algoriphagus vanfongensis]|uniref:MauE/DoxX family redox-associated membrane protein n=1 Tax=Algoriphagus vanfongensis TaxID=426371 RepID=UPI000683E994|nr:MauE/DoxX family redox-associated membrane protein [Algoriphagus vanfongensis]
MQGLDRVISTILIVLFAYTGLDKLIDFEESRKAFHNQTFPAELAEALAYAVPITELFIALLLLFSVTRWWGFLSSILLLTVFTTYVGLIWVGAFPRVPCNCAGILESLGWSAHFILNSVCILLAIGGLIVTDPSQNKQKRGGTPLRDRPPA